MRKTILITAFWAVCTVLYAQVNRANRLFDYSPAPGQFINNPAIGTPEAASKILTTDNNLVSLGAWGGTIILGFEKPVKNHPGNPYGIDFTIFGNAFSGSSEPGIVWVMNDENGNGLPDDTWYQIAGSSYFHPKTIHNNRLSWCRQPDGSAIWKDSQGKSGALIKNEFHLQPYYPDSQVFKNYPQDSVSFTGTHLVHPSFILNGQIVLPSLAFGYADNQPVARGVSPTIPDNPYTPGIREGAGGDPIDISWAVDPLGNYVDLDEIHFVKIVTGALSDLGVLGEISTEIGSVVASEPSGISGPINLMVIHPHAPSIFVGDSLLLYADFFIRGRRQNTTFVFENSDRVIAGISPSGIIKAIDGGRIRVSVFPEGYPEEVASSDIIIRKPNSILLHGFERRISAGQQLNINPVLLDLEGQPITETNWLFETENNDILEVITDIKSFRLSAYKPGIVNLTVYPSRFPFFSKTFKVEVLPSTGKIKVYASSKMNNENLFAARWIELEPFSINQYVQNRNGDYSAPGFVSAAQVAASMFQQAGINFWFRDDESAGKKLYLYSVENEGLFTYGWGGKSAPAPFARAWIVYHKSQHILSGLSEIAVSDGDSIILYHVDNLLDKWHLTGLTASSDSVSDNEKIEIYAWMVECWYNPAGDVGSTAKFPIVNQAIYLNKSTQPIAYTDQQGKSSLYLYNSLPAIINSGNDAVYIFSRQVTNVTAKNSKLLSVFPNPAADVLHIGGINSEVSVSIIDVSGRYYLIRKSLWTGIPIDVKYFSPGVYIVVVEHDMHIYRIKFVKQ